MSDSMSNYGPSADRARRLLQRRRVRWKLWISVVLGLSLLAAGVSIWIAYSGAQARAVIVVKELGGKVRWSGDRPRDGQVVSISLNASTVTDEDLARFLPWWWYLPSLQDLDLRGAKITDAGLAHLSGAPIHNLLLDGARVTSDGLKHLAGNTQLRSLSLINTGIDDDGLKHLSRLPQLGVLYLEGTPISDQGLRHLVGMKTLRYLKLGDNRGVTDAGAAELQSALPKLRIAR